MKVLDEPGLGGRGPCTDLAAWHLRVSPILRGLARDLPTPPPCYYPRRADMSLLQQVDPALLDGALHITRTLQQAGFEAYIAGGAVRNLLLGRPVNDLDIATSAPPAEIERLFLHTLPVGRQFGVIVVLLNGMSYEVATFRADSEYCDGRHPSQVRFVDVQADAFRRDLTINALFLDPNTGRILDFVGGRTDVQAGVVRTVGDPRQRFAEDKLRLMRTVRIACELGFSIDPLTFRAVVDGARGIEVVSQERIRDELLKLLTGSDPARGLGLLQETGLLEVILPEVARMVGVEQPPQFHPEGDVFVHTCLMFWYAEKPGPELALGILLHDVGKPPTFRIAERIRFDGHADLGAGMAGTICRRLRISRESTVQVVDLVRDHLRFMHVQDMRKSTLKRFLRKDNFADHLELHRLDCLASHGDLANFDFCRDKLEEFSREVIRPAPLLTGRDLIESGLKPGPMFSAILTELEDLQLEGVIRTRDEAIDWLRRRSES